MLTKKTILFFSGVSSGFFYLLAFLIGSEKLCGGSQYTNCTQSANSFFETFLPIFPLLLLSLITYKMRDEIFSTWSKFTIVWIPLSMFAILISPEYGNAFLPIEKITVAGFFSLLYVIISLIIIIWKYTTTRNDK